MISDKPFISPGKHFDTAIVTEHWKAYIDNMRFESADLSDVKIIDRKHLDFYTAHVVLLLGVKMFSTVFNC